MARETIHFVQAFRSGEGARLDADPPIRRESPESARTSAENLAPATAGVVAFATSGDAEMVEYDEEPVIIFEVGRLPAAFVHA